MTTPNLTPLTPDPTPAPDPPTPTPSVELAPVFDPTDGGRYCGNKTRFGVEGFDDRGRPRHAFCRRQAGWGTDHLGAGRCRIHGGRNGDNDRLTHGRRSTLRHKRLRDLVDQHRANPDPLNMLDEVAQARALFQNFVERYAKNNAALHAWHESWQAQTQPMNEEKLMAFERVVTEYENLRKEHDLELTQRQSGELAMARAFVDALRHRAGVAMKPRKVLDIADGYRIVESVTKIIERIETIRAQNAISRPEFVRLMHEMGRAVMRYVPDRDALVKIDAAWGELRF